VTTVTSELVYKTLIKALQARLKPTISPGTVAFTMVLVAAQFEALTKKISSKAGAQSVCEIITGFDPQIFNAVANSGFAPNAFKKPAQADLKQVTDIIITSLDDDYREDFYPAIVIKTLCAMAVRFTLLHFKCDFEAAKTILQTYLSEASDEDLNTSLLTGRFKPRPAIFNA